MQSQAGQAGLAGLGSYPTSSHLPPTKPPAQSSLSSSPSHLDCPVDNTPYTNEKTTNSWKYQSFQVL